MKTPTQQFIEDAMAGGYDEGAGEHDVLTGHDPHFHDGIIAQILLDPLAWQAVGKTRDWNQGERAECPACSGRMSVDWRYYMHAFIESIAIGETIDEALAAISENE